MKKSTLSIILVLQCMTMVCSLLVPVNQLLFLLFVMFGFLLLKVSTILFENRQGTYLYVAYSILLFCCVLTAILNYNGYDNFFGGQDDDSFYFYRANDLAQGIDIGISSLFEQFYGVILKGLHLLVEVDKLSVLYLLPINCAFISVGLEAINKITSLVCGTDFGWKSFLVLILNCNFLSNCVLLYREAMLLCFFPLTVYYIIKKNYIKMIIPLFIVFNLRGANGFILLVVFLFKVCYPYIKKMRKLYMVVVIGAVFVAYYLFDYLTPYLSFAGQETSAIGLRIAEREALGNEQGIGFIYRSNILRLIYFLFVPIKFVPIVGETEIIQRISTWQRVEFYAYTWHWMAIISAITTITLPYIVPRVILAIKKGIQTQKENIVIVSIMIVFSWMCVAIFSMQVRHFAVLIMFFPMLYTVWLQKKTKLEEKYCNIFGTLVVGCILIINIIH